MTWAPPTICNLGTAHQTTSNLMSNYRRSQIPGGCYFFTVVTYRRRPLLIDPEARGILRAVIEEVKASLPFTIDAWVLMPEHIHCIWTLPTGDHDFSKRWGRIKAGFSKGAKELFRHEAWLNDSRRRHRESVIWQRRFWEHAIRDGEDYNRHMDYLHYNPVKHGLAERVRDWPYSTFHRHVKRGVYAVDWGGDIAIPTEGFGE